MARDDALLYRLVSGVASLRIESEAIGSLIVGLIFPGDVLPRALCASKPLTVVAQTPVEIVGEGLGDGDVVRQMAALQRRLALRIAAVTAQDARPRIAAFFIELGLRIGVPAGSGYSIDMPLTRAEIAACTGINADTYSRIFSEMKASGVLVQRSRQRLLIADWERLLALSPLSDALFALHGAARRS